MADADQLSYDGEAMLSRQAVLALAALALAFGVVIVGGYRLGWSWTGFSDNGTIWDWLQLLVLPITGFPGKTLWDWLDLLVLPFSLSLLPISLGSSWSRFCETRLALGLLVIAGYSLDWRWTGFQGNTFWDWLHLLLVPFLLPASVTWLSARTRAPRADAVRST